jgi:uncharacterized MAPEG superfamily protein
MSFETHILGWAVVLAAAQLILLAVAANLQLGTRYLAGPRDERRELTGPPARLQRAFLNHLEGLAFFAPASILVALADASSGFTAACATIYLMARIAYIPAYAFGVPWLRSAIWALGFLATMAMLPPALF